MADNITDSGVPAGTDDKPTSPVSTGSAPVHSGGDATLAEVLQNIKVLQGHVAALQSEKDRGVHKLTSRVDDIEVKLLTEYEELRSSGMTPEKAKRELRVNALLAAQEQQANTQAPQASGTGTTAPTAGVDAQTVFEAMGFNAGGEEVTRVLREHPNDTVAQINALAAMKTKATQVRQPNPAQVMSSGGGTSVAAEDVEGLTRKLSDLQKNPTANRKQIAEIAKQLEPLLPKR